MNTSKKSSKKVVASKKATRKVASPVKVNRNFSEKALKEKEHTVAVQRVEEKATRMSRAARERKAAAAILKKSLIAYPKNPRIGERVWEYDDTKKAAKGGKGKGKRKGGRGAKGEARKALREANRLAKEQAKAERLQAREQKRIERAQKKALAKMPAITLSPKKVGDIMLGIQEKFGLKDRNTTRLGKQLERLSKMPPTRLRNVTKRFQVKMAMLDALGELIKEELAKVKVDEPAAPRRGRKAAAKKANGSLELPVSEAKKSKSRRDSAAEIGARLAMMNKVPAQDSRPRTRVAAKAKSGKGKK